MKPSILALKIFIILTALGMILGWFISPDLWTKLPSYLVTLLLPFLPDFLKLFKLTPSQPLIFTYELFIIIAMVFGINLNFYSQLWITPDGDSFYDKLVHFLSGAFEAVVAWEALVWFMRSISKQGITNLRSLAPAHRLLAVTFLLGVVALIALIWECYEFAYDCLFDGHMQQLVKEGLSDTMWDMIVSLLGGVCTVVVLFFHPKPTPKSSKLPQSQKS